MEKIIRLSNIITIFVFLYFLTFDCAFSYSIESSLCVSATSQAEKALHIPDGLLFAMSRVESGRHESDGNVAPWPWTVTVSGTGHYYRTRDEAIEAVKMFQMEGSHSIDVGCMQVNLQQHPDAFSSLEQAFNPVSNANYAGTFLLQMYDRMGSWPRAAAAYHSQTPSIGTPYQWKVLEAWAVPQGERSNQSSGRRSRYSRRNPLWDNVRGAEPLHVIAPERHPTFIAPVRDFHPFMGNRHYSELPSPHHINVKGRSLASYRASPVMLAVPTHSR